MVTKFLSKVTSKSATMSRNTRSKTALQEKNNKDPNVGVFTNTNGHVSQTLHLDCSKIYSIFDNQDFSVIPHEQPAYAKIRSSQIQCITSKPPFMPYINPIKWKLDYSSPKERSFDDHFRNPIASFHPYVFARAYALIPPQQLLTGQFLDASITQFDYEEVTKS